MSARTVAPSSWASSLANDRALKKRATRTSNRTLTTSSSASSDRLVWITSSSTTVFGAKSNNNNDNDNDNDKETKRNDRSSVKTTSYSSSSSSFGGSSVLEDFDGQKPEIGGENTTYFSSSGRNPLRGAKSRAENAMRTREFSRSNSIKNHYANGGSAAFGSMVPDDVEASTSGQQREKEEEMSDIKKRTMKALNCKRQDLPDGSVLFSFSEKPLTRRQKAALIMEEEKLQISSSDFESSDFECRPSVIERWFMTVRFQAATVSVEKAFVFILSTPFRVVFWTFAYAIRLLFWVITGRFDLLFSLSKGKRRASKQLAANYSQMEIEKLRREKIERERAFVEGSAKVARERLKL
jgi:hypothetical protein